MEFHSFLTFFLNSYHSFCRCISFHLFDSRAPQRNPFFHFGGKHWALQSRKKKWLVEQWMGGEWGSSLPLCFRSLSSIFESMALSNFKKLWPDYSHLSHLERHVGNYPLGGKKKNSSFQFGVEISIMLRDTVLPTAVGIALATHPFFWVYLLLVSQGLLTPSHSMVQNMFLLLCSEWKHFQKSLLLCNIYRPV